MRQTQKIIVLVLAAAALTVFIYRYSMRSIGEAPIREAPKGDTRPETTNTVAPRLQASSKGNSVAHRLPSAHEDEGIAELNAESAGRWIFKKRDDGFISKMSEGSIGLGVSSPELAAEKFLERFSTKLFGVNKRSLSRTESKLESEGAQIVYQQAIDGVAVVPSRINLLFDLEGNLIYALSDVYTGASPPPPASLLTADESASIARAALLKFLSTSGNSSLYSRAFFISHGGLIYRLVNGSISLVYRYQFPLFAPLEGDFEILIDASSGAVLVLRTLTRK